MIRAIILAAFGLALMVGATFVSEASAQTRRQKAAPVVVEPMPKAGIFSGKLRQKIVLNLVRHHTIKKLMSDGLKGKKLSRAEAEAAYDKLTEEVVLAAVEDASPDTAAQLQAVGGPLTDFLQWLSDHSDQIMKIVELVMKIMALFA